MFATELLSDQLVLRAAWRRMRRWYDGAEWVPQPELARFELQLDENLERLGRELSSGAYSPKPFRLVPYPKSGGALRHYSVPSVDDQVAFTVFLVLLGPLVDIATVPFAFGNRWHRALVRDRSTAKPHWRARPYALDAPAFYLPYRRDFALFRRCCHWTATAMLGGQPDADIAAAAAVTLDDFSAEELPNSCRPQWWHAANHPVPKSGVWGRLDLQLAYPSMRIERLRERLDILLGALSDDDVRGALAAYPPHIAGTLVAVGERVALGRRLTDALVKIRFETAPIGDLWIPAHASQKLPREGKTDDPGIPTGLAVSGALLNVYLHAFDSSMQSWMDSRARGARAALLRFADDMIVIAQDLDVLAEALDSIWCALENDEAAVLGAPRTDPAAMNLRINLSKIEPTPLASKVGEYLAACNWSECRPCGRRVEPSERVVETLPTFRGWLRTQPPKDWLVGHHLRPDRVGPFVTHLVERMSATGSETLDERFGEGARARLVDLHQLLRLRIDDTHVRADTRLAFAANRIARAFLPNEGGPLDAGHVEEIRRSVAEAINLVPWKFALWRAALHAACRRPLTVAVGATEDETASIWLGAKLAYLADSSKDDSWLVHWPEELKACHPGTELRPLYLSFLRAAFWRAVAAAVRDLHDVPGAKDPEGAGRPWSVQAWTFRAVDEKRAPKVTDWLSKLDVWVGHLYPEKAPTQWWELDALALAVLAVTNSDAFAVPPDVSGPPTAASVVVVPAALPGTGSGSLPRATDLLARAGRVIGAAAASNMDPVTRWAHFGFSRRPGKKQLTVAAKALYETLGPRPALRAARSLALLSHLPRKAASLAPSLAKSLESGVPTLAQLAEYDVARRLATAVQRRKTDVSEPMTLHGLLWSTFSSPTDISFHPSGAPGVGLPVRVAAQMLREALTQELARARPDTGPPVWLLTKPGDLAEARWSQLAGKMSVRSLTPGPMVRLGARNDWETLPHGAYFLPRAVADPSNVLSLNAWAHLLQFFTAAQGSERFLDHVLATWPSPVPFDERWAQRSEIPLPTGTWGSIELLLRAALVQNEERVRTACDDLLMRLPDLTDSRTAADFAWERVDVSLTLGDRAVEASMGCVPMAPAPPTLDALLVPDPKQLAKQIRLRVCQISEKPDWDKYRDRFKRYSPPRIPRAERQRIMDQVRVGFTDTDTGKDAEATLALGPVIFPEMALPLEEVSSFRRAALRRRRAALIGLHWSLVPPACATTVHSHVPSVRYLANEAFLAVPTEHPSDPEVVVLRTFLVRKPLPTHLEHGLTASLSKDKKLGSQWRMLAGTRWYRFLHPRWGDFTVAICSDLIDPAPWHSMQGQILHLLLVSYNRDVDLYESLTWVRAYECHANVVGTNHGDYGGSIVWTPNEGASKEIARLRGSRLFLAADVVLDVARLEAHQRSGTGEAVEKARREWNGQKSSKGSGFKAPPPGFPPRQ